MGRVTGDSRYIGITLYILASNLRLHNTLTHRNKRPQISRTPRSSDKFSEASPALAYNLQPSDPLHPATNQSPTRFDVALSVSCRGRRQTPLLRTIAYMRR